MNMFNSTIPCKHCGKPENEHHEFEPNWPSWCKCDPHTWGKLPSPVCAEFTGDDDQYCSTCEHDKACHTIQPGLAQR